MEKLFKYICDKVDEAELYKKEEKFEKIMIMKGEVKSIDGKNSIGLSLRINKDNKIGTSISTSIDDLSIVDRAIISSTFKKEKKAIFKNVKCKEVKCYDSELDKMSIEAIVNEGIRISNKIKLIDDTLEFSLKILRVITDIHIMNSSGFNDSYKKSTYSIELETISKFGFCQVAYFNGKTNFFKMSDEEIEDLVKRHYIANEEYELDTQFMTVVFSGRAMGALMLRLLAGVNGELVEKGISPLKDKINKKISKEILSVYDDATIEGSPSSYKFDDEGINAQNTCLIKHGVFQNFLVSVDLEKDLNRKATGNSLKETMFTKDIKDELAINCSNMIVEGDSIPDEEIIKNIKRGIYIEEVMGIHIGNIPQGEYSLNISIGYYIEDGELKGKIVDSMVSGNIYEDFFKIEAIGTKKELMKGLNGSVGYSPMVKFNDLNVTGSK